MVYSKFRIANCELRIFLGEEPNVLNCEIVDPNAAESAYGLMSEASELRIDQEFQTRDRSASVNR